MPKNNECLAHIIIDIGNVNVNKLVYELAESAKRNENQLLLNMSNKNSNKWVYSTIL